MNNRYQIMQQLADGRFHSGQALANVCNISRTAVWKHIQALRDLLDIDIFSVRGKGYRLESPIELLQEQKITDGLSTQGRSRLSGITLLNQVDSTNRYLLDLANPSAKSGAVCLAEQQTAGRGRHGRQWISPFGSNIYLSILWAYPSGPAELGGLSLAAGLAIVRALEQLGITGVGLKWPNDLMWDGRKLAGLLLEINGESTGPSRVVVGVGLNTTLPSRHGTLIDQPWTKLSEIPGGEGLSRNRIAAVLIDVLLDTLEQGERHGIGHLIKDWEQYDLLINRPIELQFGKQIIEGIHRGIDIDGGLLLEQQGKIRVFHGGEVTTRIQKT